MGQQEHERRWKYKNMIESKIESVWVSRSTSAGESVKNESECESESVRMEK